MSFCQTRNRSTQSSNVAMRRTAISANPPNLPQRSWKSPAIRCQILLPSPSAVLAASEVRRTLLQERVQPFEAILGKKALLLLLNLRSEERRVGKATTA